MNDTAQTAATDDGLPSRMVSAATAAKMYEVGVSTWWRWDQAGRIPQPIRMGGTTRWRRAELEAWDNAGCPDRLAWQAMQQ